MLMRCSHEYAFMRCSQREYALGYALPSLRYASMRCSQREYATIFCSPRACQYTLLTASMRLCAASSGGQGGRSLRTCQAVSLRAAVAYAGARFLTAAALRARPPFLRPTPTPTAGSGPTPTAGSDEGGACCLPLYIARAHGSWQLGLLVISGRPPSSARVFAPEVPTQRGGRGDSGDTARPDGPHQASTMRVPARGGVGVRGTGIRAHQHHKAGIRPVWPRRALVPRPRCSALGPPSFERQSQRDCPGGINWGLRDKLA